MDDPSVGVGRGDEYPVGRLVMSSAFADGGPPEGPCGRPCRRPYGTGRKTITFSDRFRNRLSASSPTAMPTPMVLPESDGRRGVFVVLRKSSDFQRLPSENLQSDNLADFDDGKRQGQAVFTLPSLLCVRMHFVCSRMQSVCTFSARARS